MIDALSSALSGLDAAAVRLNASAHNVANLATESFRPLQTTQVEGRAGGTEVHVDRMAEPSGTSLAREVGEQIRARTQLSAALRVIGAAGKTRGSLVDLLA
jgi:hypothetical protein